MSKRIVCTDTEWIGRADCNHCSVRRLMLFSELPDSAFDKHLYPIDNIKYKNGCTLYEEDINGGAVYSIRSGMVKLVHLAPDGVLRIVRLLGPGSVLGLELMDGGIGYRHSAITLSPVDACKIPVKTLFTLEHKFPELCQRIRLLLQDNLDSADQWIVTLNTGTALHRVAHLLLMLDQFSPHPNNEIELLSREDMGAIVGISHETVCRILTDLKRKKIIKKITNNRHQIDPTSLNSITQEMT